MIARRFEVGAEHPETVDVRPGMADRLDDRQLLWIDASPEPETLERIDAALGLDGVVRAVGLMEEPSLRFRRGAIGLCVVGLEAHDEPGRPAPVLVRLVAVPNIVVSIHQAPVLGLEEPVTAVAEDPRFGDLRAGTFVGLLLDGMVGGHLEELEAIEREVDTVDERALAGQPTERVLDTLVSLRRRIGVIRRSLTSQREVYTALARPAGEEVSPIGVPWPEVSARLERAIDAAEHSRELLVGTFDIVMARTSQRTNDIVRALTVISIVLLPSGVIAGVMGMNFHPAFFDDPRLFFVVAGVMIAIALVTLLLAQGAPLAVSAAG